MSSIIVSRLPPEILQDIFKYNVEIKTHHSRYKDLATSCLLVNRYWCMNAISIIWEEPLNICVDNEKSLEKILKIYISNLPRKSKLLLIKNSECQFEISSKQPTFNYASFLQKLELQSLYDTINRFILQKTYYTTYTYQKTAKQRIGLLRELVKHFISEKIYHKISKIFSDINDLQIFCNLKDNTALASLINTLPTSPLKLTLYRCSMPTTSITKSLSSKLNNLTSLIIHERGSIPLETFKECTKLKLFQLDNFKHHHFDDATKDADELKDIINYKSLNNLDEFDLYQLAVNNLHVSNILQNTNNNLKVLRIKWIKSVDPENEELLFKSIMENCTMLNELVISLTTSAIKYFPSCIRTLTRLQNLTIDRYEDDQSLDEDMCTWAEILGINISMSIKILLLDRNLQLNNEAFDKFLCQCYNRGIKNLHLIVDRPRFIQIDEKIKETLMKYIQSGTLNSETNL
ncbi:7599_t:CDS:2 [Scutellospora calospora]|uniref:7599_t:CDS:1 n=1 Tax=Scutellospora calospora TaxID=85575 RepID=A0ACA9LD57_9GLOM|nr:7599_t:CDS:2 [Scutellospora calospora]